MESLSASLCIVFAKEEFDFFKEKLSFDEEREGKSNPTRRVQGRDSNSAHSSPAANTLTYIDSTASLIYFELFCMFH